MRRFIYLIVFTLLNTQVFAANYKEIKWDDLIPETDLEILKKMNVLLSNPHLSMDMDLELRQEILIAQSQLEDPEVQAVMNSINVQAELNKQSVSLSGFVVPLEMDDESIITEFFLVPYFGACIHVPPPPPNQIIYVHYKKGLQVSDISIPFEIKGTLFTEIMEDEGAVSAYSFTADKVSEYKE